MDCYTTQRPPPRSTTTPSVAASSSAADIELLDLVVTERQLDRSPETIADGFRQTPHRERLTWANKSELDVGNSIIDDRSHRGRLDSVVPLWDRLDDRRPQLIVDKYGLPVQGESGMATKTTKTPVAANRSGSASGARTSGRKPASTNMRAAMKMMAARFVAYSSSARRACSLRPSSNAIPAVARGGTSATAIPTPGRAAKVDCRGLRTRPRRQR